MTYVSPGLTAGRGLKPVVGNQRLQAHLGIARPHGRARIETYSATWSWPLLMVSPGLTAGRGLKLLQAERSAVTVRYRPASRPGAD